MYPDCTRDYLGPPASVATGNSVNIIVGEVDPSAEIYLWKPPWNCGWNPFDGKLQLGRKKNICDFSMEWSKTNLPSAISCSDNSRVCNANFFDWRRKKSLSFVAWMRKFLLLFLPLTAVQHRHHQHQLHVESQNNWKLLLRRSAGESDNLPLFDSQFFKDTSRGGGEEVNPQKVPRQHVNKFHRKLYHRVQMVDASGRGRGGGRGE